MRRWMMENRMLATGDDHDVRRRARDAEWPTAVAINSHGTSVVAGQRAALRRSALRAVRRDTAVTVESAWCSAFAVRVDGSRRSAASARRCTSARVSGTAIASSNHIRSRLEKNAHMLNVPSSSPCGVPRRYRIVPA
jgi:hypothetical protein